MGLLDNIKKTKFGLGGKTPNVLDQSLPTSTLHKTTSVNGTPVDKNGRKPSSLDLNAKTPKKYLDTPPK
jgi:hypothetical protein